MKEKKTKNHKENWIGNIIRGFLLFMPLLAIGVTCAYAIFNKNAYQDKPVNLITLKNETRNLITNQNYTLFFTGDTTGQTNNTTALIKINTISIDVPQNTYYIRFTNDNRVAFYDVNEVRISGSDVLENVSYTVAENITLVNQPWFKNYISLTTYDSLENIFYYSIDKVQQSPLFNWSTDTGMYNVIHGACTTLGIESTFVPFLLAYWLLTYLIYIIYDIALLIVNMAHNRIHDVESSI